jgi:hypothetical protein
MPCYFSAEHIAELNRGRAQVRRQYRDLSERFFVRGYKTDRGAEFAKHGFCRRMETLVHIIDQIFRLLPPELDKIPPRDQVVDATIAIHAFTLNAFGCLDNIAWVWVYEKEVKGKGGAELAPIEVGLGKKLVRKSLTKEFQDLLDRRQNWLANLIDFRDSLAHRIPLYIPPYVVPRPNVGKYNELEAAAMAAPARRDPKEYERIRAEQKALCQFLPGMTHSIFEEAPSVEFHSQLLNDYVTLDEYGRTLLEELDR